MKKFLIICFLTILIVQSGSVFKSAAAEKTVKVSLPTFRVQINGIMIDSKTAEYPLLLYKDITYMPMTYDFCNLLGLESNWTKENGLVVSVRKSNTIPTITEGSSKYSNQSRAIASIAGTPITINNKKIDNLKEPYPFLVYKNVTYFPLTYKFTKEEFNIYSNFIPEAGLGVYSENKYFYKYYAAGSNVQSIDLRISSILYLMTAINISDGTGKYPSNNIRQYYFESPGVVLLPNYKDVKYYGYLPDGNGGLKVNTDSKLNIGELTTTVINDLKNPEPAQVVLSFAQYYN